MWAESVQLDLAPGAHPSDLAILLRERLGGLPGFRHLAVGANLPGSWGASDCTLDLLFEHDPGQALAERLAQLPGVARLERHAYRRIGGGLREPHLRGGIWRTLLLHVKTDAAPGQREALQRDLLRMPEYMQGIRNWQLSEVIGDSRWSYVWQQEFADLGDLQGEYLAHPYHWGWVDRWFDPEFPEWLVDSIAHAFCPFDSSLLSLAQRSAL